MTDYVKSTNFASKDSLSVGNPLKIVKGTEIDTEFTNIATAVATKADSATVTSSLALKADTSTVDLKAPLASPALTGTPTVPTASVNTNTTQAASTAFVVAQIADDAPTKTGTGATGTWGISITGNADTASTVTTITTTQVLNATAGASVGAVGTYAFLARPTSSGLDTTPGNTLAGSSLRYAGGSSWGGGQNGVQGISTTAPSGTWRAMGYQKGGVYDPCYSSTDEVGTLWLRIS